MEKSTPTELHSVFVVMSEQVEQSHLRTMTQGMGKKQRRDCIAEYLKAFSESRQKDLLDYLFSMQQIGEVDSIQSLWFVNIVSFRATTKVIETIVQYFDTKLIDWDCDGRFINAMERVVKPSYQLQGLAWQLVKVRAPEVWAAGYTGLDIIISIIDSGVRYTHYDLADHMWTNAGEIPNDSIDNDNNGYIDDYYGYDFYYDQPDPMDCFGHGTAVAGMAAGDGTAGCTTGVAPDARIMALKIADSTGYGSLTGMLEAFQYSLDMGADVVNISYGIPGQNSTWRGLFRECFVTLLTADMLITSCAGNSGNQQGTYPIPYNIWTPGDSPPPWLHPDQTLIGGLSACMTIGATDSTDLITDFSSRGPVTWQDNSPWFDYAYNPGMGLIDPDLSAPGLDVNILWVFSDSSYLLGYGTSFASPMTAGAAALLLSVDPELQPSFIDSVIEMTSVDLGEPGKDNIYGAGRLDCYAAYVGVAEQEYNHIVYTTISCSPNPFRYHTDISFSIGQSVKSIELKIYNATGRLVKDLTNYQLPFNRVVWDATDDAGRPVPSGVYFLKFKAGDYSATEKLLLIR
jgi:serine protease AprX